MYIYPLHYFAPLMIHILSRPSVTTITSLGHTMLGCCGGTFQTRFILPALPGTAVLAAAFVAHLAGVCGCVTYCISHHHHSFNNCNFLVLSFSDTLPTSFYFPPLIPSL